MKRVLKWIGITLGPLVILACIAIYGVSEYRLRQTFAIAATPIAVPTDSAAIAAGRHIFETRGCEGCHGPGLSGKVFFDEPWLARLIAPNVPKAIRGYSEPRTITHDASRAPKGPDAASLGRYIAMSSCTECHGQRLQGDPQGAPALIIVGGYTPSEFAKLMRDGVPKDGKEREMMSPVVRSRFSHFTDEEVNALYAFLAGKGPAAN